MTVLIGLGLSGCGSDDPEYPERLVAVGGEYYKGEMGSAVLDPELRFAVQDSHRNYVAGAVIQLRLLEGDGTLTANSITAGADGIASAGYTFSGALGHAVVEAIGRNGADTIDVVLRANTLIPGDHGQGQYVLLDDLYSDVIGINGAPARVDPFGTVAVANYEAELGMVVICYDIDSNGVLPANAPVHGVIVVDSVYWQPPDLTSKNNPYEGMTADSIMIGSKYHADIVPVYGPADSISVNSEDPSLVAVVIEYDDLHLKFWCHPSDTTVFQIDIFEEFDGSLYGKPVAIPRNLGRRVRELTAE